MLGVEAREVDQENPTYQANEFKFSPGERLLNRTVTSLDLFLGK